MFVPRGRAHVVGRSDDDEGAGNLLTMSRDRTGPGLWGGSPATLLRKVEVVAAEADRLPVYTLTFANPEGVTELGMGVRIDHGDTVKVCVPGYKPKSYSMSACREGEFDITFKVYPGGRASGYLDGIEVGGTIDVFPKGRKTRDAGAFVGLVAFGVGITEALPMLAVRLVELGMSSEVKPYAQTQAILGTFSIIDKGVTDKENAEQLAKVRETLERLDWRAGRPT